MSGEKAQRKVVVVDDDPVALETASHLLRQAGFEVATYDKAYGRLSFIVREQPDLVLLDVNMPLVPGDELCQLIREEGSLRETPVVLFSSNDERTLREQVLACGASGFITKSEMGFGLGQKVMRLMANGGRARASLGQMS